VIASRQVPIPDFIDIWFLDREAEPTDRTAMETVIDTVRNEKDRLEKLEEEIMTDVGPEDPRLEAIYEKLEKIDPSTFEKRAGARRAAGPPSRREQPPPLRRARIGTPLQRRPPMRRPHAAPARLLPPPPPPAWLPPPPPSPLTPAAPPKQASCSSASASR
jgi:hypothetical protein